MATSPLTEEVEDRLVAIEAVDTAQAAELDALNTQGALTTGASPVVVPLTALGTHATTGDTAGAEVATVADGTYAGQRKVVYATITDTGDIVRVQRASGNLVGVDGSTALSSVDLDATGEWVDLMWNGTNWVIQGGTNTENAA